VARVELLASAAQPAALLARLARTVSTELAAMQATEATAAWVLKASRELLARILAKPEAMDFREAMAAQAVQGAEAALVPDLPRVESAELVATAATLAWPEVAATAELVML